MNTYTSNDSLFSNINKKGGISLISKINQNSNGNFKLVDIVDIDWDGSTVYTYNDNGDTTKNIINDSAQFLSIFQNTINRVENNNFNKYVQTIDNVKDYYNPETETWTTGYTDGLVTATDVTKHIIDNEYVVSTHLNNFSTELTNTYNSLYTELNNQTNNLQENLDNITYEYSTYISNLENDLSNLITTVGEHTTYISNLENSLSSVQTSLTKRIDVHATDISSLQSSLSNLTNTVNNNINVVTEHTTYISDLQNDLSGLTTTVVEHATYISNLQNDLSDLTTTVGKHDTYISDLTLLGVNLGISVEQNKNNICAILEQTKASNYYNSNDYMKLDYYGSTFYDESISNYTYSASMHSQHMYFDNDLTTFIPGLPYQNPFKALVTLKMPLAFDTIYNNSKQQILLCQDFIWGDGQNDHEAMCPLWYERGGLSFGGATISGINLSNSIAKYSGNSTLPLFNTADEYINISFGIIDNIGSDGEQSYSESIIADVTTDVFELVQNTVNISDLVGKDLVLICSRLNMAAYEFSSKYYLNTAINILGNLASITSNIQRFGIELSDDFETSKKIYLKESNTGKYVGYASKDFVLSDTKVVEDYYIISIDDNNNLILTTAQGYVVCYNPSSPRFKPYDRSYMEANNGYIQLYVKQEVKPEKVSPELSWASNISLIELRLGTQSTYTNKCLTPEGLTPEYSSSNTNIAVVNSNGVVTLLKPGEVTITATTQETDTYLAEAIQYKIRILEKIVVRNNPFRYLNAFIYPLIRITDTTGHTYSPVIISASDNSKTIIKEKYIWMKNTDTINSLRRSINNPSYRENNKSFIIEHINQINKCFIGTEDSSLPENSIELNSNRLNGRTGNIELTESVLLSSINKNDTIELLTIDKDGHIISCGLSNTYDELKNNYNEYKQYVNSQITDEYLEKYPWLF